MHRACAAQDIFGGSHTYVTTLTGIGFGNQHHGSLHNGMLGPVNGKKILAHTWYLAQATQTQTIITCPESYGSALTMSTGQYPTALNHLIPLGIQILQNRQ